MYHTFSHTPFVFRLSVCFMRLLIKTLHFAKERFTLCTYDINVLKMFSGESLKALFVLTCSKTFSKSLCNKSPRLAYKSSILAPDNGYTRI